MGVERRPGRVADSHRIAISALRLAAVFVGLAAVWALVIGLRGGWWWGPFHAFLAGGVTLAISGTAQMFTVTWSAAPTPDRRVAATQRWVTAIGAAAVLAGVPFRSAAVVIAGATTFVIGLGALAASLYATIRRSLLRRFDLSARFYLLGLGAGMLGSVVGALIGAGWMPDRYADLRLVHSRLNLVGFIGSVIAGTLPTLLPTVARHRAVSGREARWAWRLSVAGVVMMASALFASTSSVSAMFVSFGAISVGVALLVIAAGVVVRLGRRAWRSGGAAYAHLVAGSMWLVSWVVFDAARLLAAAQAPPFGREAAGVVVVGLGQILVGSLLYLVPVLAGPGPRLGRNLATTHRRGWLSVGLANASGAVALIGADTVAVGLAMVWFVDVVGRLVRVRTAQVEPLGDSGAIEHG